jgi:hypothetical protein
MIASILSGKFMLGCAPMVMGSKRLEHLVNSAPHINWGMGCIFMTEMAHEMDKDKYYWIVRKNNHQYITVSCTLTYGQVGWGTIRENKDGKMEICQIMPRHIEVSLRKQVYEKLKFELSSNKSKALSCVPDANKQKGS